MYREPINPITEKEKAAVLSLTKYFGEKWIIVDAGSNKGLWVDLLLNEREPSNKHEELEVHLIEPNKLLLDYTRVKYEHSNKIFYHNIALGSNENLVKFWYFEDNHSGISNLIGNWQELKPMERVLTTQRLDKVFDKEIDILKLDIEGYEYQALLGSLNLLKDKKIKFIQVEYSEHYKTINLHFKKIIDYMATFDYKCWDYVDNEFKELKSDQFNEDYHLDNYYFTYLPIGKYYYTQNWNEQFIKNTEFLKKQVDFALEIGAAEGLTSNYICDNLLSKGSRMIVIDPLEDKYTDWSDEKTNNMFVGQYERFIRNTVHQPIELIRKKSEDAYNELDQYLFTFCFIDGDHSPEAVFKDGEFAFNHLKIGGYILFDDYNWSQGDKHTKDGIDKFLNKYKKYLEIIVKDEQVMIQKTDNKPTWQEEFDESRIYAAYTNLDERIDRNEKMIKEIEKANLSFTIHRQRSFPWKELWDKFSEEEKQRNMVMYRRTKGAVGCHHSQVNIMKKALEHGNHAIVLEDDLVFCDDIQERLKILFEFLHDRQWDIAWFGGTYHREEGGIWHKLDKNGNHIHPDLRMCKCKFGTDYLPTDNPKIVQTIGAFSTHAYMVNKDSIQKVLDALDKDLHLSMGIDWLMLLHQPEWKCFAFNPGCIKQYNSQSNISEGIANQEAFRNLGKHWWSRKMNEYIPD